MRYDKDKGEFVSHTVTKNNVMKIDIQTDSNSFIKLGGKGHLKHIKLSGREAVADTGASLNCSPTIDISKYGLTEDRLLKSHLNLFVGDKRKLNIKGYIPVKFTARSENGSFTETTDLLYFVDGLKKTFLSKDALAQLRVIPQNFPVSRCRRPRGGVCRCSHS